MPIGGMLFEKDVNPVSRRIQRLFEGIRAAYLSAKQQPKEYSKEWRKEIEALNEDYNATDDLASALREVINDDDIESSEAKNPASHIASKIYEAIIGYHYKYLKVADQLPLANQVTDFGKRTTKSQLKKIIV